MIVIALIAVLSIVTALMAYHRLSLGYWTASILTISWSYWWFFQQSIFGMVFPVLLTFLLLLFNIKALRRQIITSGVYKTFKKLLPPMSETERTALNAGDTWWDAELFTGKPNWQRLLETPEPKLTNEEQAFIDGPVSELCEMIDDWEITHYEKRLPDDVWQFMKDSKLFGMIIPKQYGGLEFSALAHSHIVMMIASRSVSAAVTIMVPNSLGPAELLLQYGTEQQKEYYLPRLATGQEIPCFALTAPEAGSDASSIPDTGVVCFAEFEGKDTLGIRLNWKKRYITLGPVATLLGLAFQLRDPDNLLGKGEDVGITCALIPTNTPGIKIGRRHYPMNQAFQNGPNEGHDVFIPMDWVIGGQQQLGQGWKMLMESLAAGRSISLPSLSVGGAKLASRAAGAYSRIREQFGMPIGRFEGIEEVLARIASNTYMMDATRIMTIGALDRGHHPAVISAIVKQQLTERMRISVNDAMDIQGGAGISMGPHNLFARIYEALPISITVEGANILTRNLIIFGQGAVRCHPYLFEEMTAATDKTYSRGLKRFDNALFSHIGMFLSNATRSLWLGITNGRSANVPVRSEARRYLQQLNRMSAAFALVADACMLSLGGALKRKEHLSARLADVFSLLYLTSATIKHFEDHGADVAEIPLLRAACHDCFYRIQESLHGVMRNLPNKPLALMLRWMVFPRGRAYSAPYDEFLHDAAALLLKPSVVRDRLTKGVYISHDPDSQIYRLEYALQKVIAAEPAEKKLKQLIRTGFVTRHPDMDITLAEAYETDDFTDDEIQRLKRARKARLNVIQVDDFDPDLGLGHDAAHRAFREHFA